MSEPGQRAILDRTVEIYEACISAAENAERVLKLILTTPPWQIETEISILLNCSREAAREIRHCSMDSLTPDSVRRMREEIALLRTAASALPA